jgi:hypothetical protein
MRNLLASALLSSFSLFTIASPALADWVSAPASPLPGQIELLNYQEDENFGPSGPFFRREDGVPAPVLSFGEAHTDYHIGDCVLVYGTFENLSAESPVLCLWLTAARYKRYDLTTFADAFGYVYEEVEDGLGVHVNYYMGAESIGTHIEYNDNAAAYGLQSR